MGNRWKEKESWRERRRARVGAGKILFTIWTLCGRVGAERRRKASEMLGGIEGLKFRKKGEINKTTPR